MDFGLYWISLGVLLIIIEVFLLTLDFLALGLAAIITGIIVIVFDIGYDQWWVTGIIFLISGLINLVFFKKYLFPYIKASIKAESPMSMDNFAGEKLVVKILDGNPVGYFQGAYWNLYSEDELKNGNTVEVLGFKENGLEVKKIK